MTERTCTRFDVEGGVATLTIDRPKALNALDSTTLDEIDAAIDAVVADTSVRALIITGAGDKAFVAGADISRMPSMSPADAKAFSERGSGIFARLEALDIPVVAAVNGFALGGGCELLLACDYAYASTRAKFGQPEVKLGIIAGFGGTQRLPRKIGYGPAMELLLSGGMIGADDALRLGLVNKVVEPDELMDAVRTSVDAILSRGPRAVALTKQLVRASLDTTLADGLADETAQFEAVFDTAERVEGVTAFLEKRTPNFTGE